MSPETARDTDDGRAQLAADVALILRLADAEHRDAGDEREEEDS